MDGIGKAIPPIMLPVAWHVAMFLLFGMEKQANLVRDTERTEYLGTISDEA